MFFPIILAVAPSMIWLLIFYYSNAYHRSTSKTMLMLFFPVFLSGLMALTLNHVTEKYSLFWPGSTDQVTLFKFIEPIKIYSHGFWFMVGLNEEFAKMVALLFIALPSKELLEKFDGILYAVTVSLGFATIENLFYLSNYGSEILLARAMVAIPAHAFMTVPIGICLYYAKANAKLDSQNNIFKLALICLTGWMISAFLHGLYDLLISTNLEVLAYIQVISMGFIILIVGRNSLVQSSLKPPTINN